MSRFLTMSQCHMISIPPIFPYSVLKSNIYHISYIILHLQNIKTQVSSNYFELTRIVHTICPNSVKIPFFYHFPSFTLKLCKNTYYVPTWEFPTYFPLNFPLGKNLAHFPLIFSDQTQNVFKLMQFKKSRRS